MPTFGNHCRAAVIAALSVAAGALPAGALTAENQAFIRITEACVASPTVDAGLRALRTLPHERETRPVPGGYVAAAVFAPPGSTIMTFLSQSPASPIEECKIVGFSDNLSELVTALKAKWSLGDRHSGTSETTIGATVASGGRSMAVRMNYLLQDNGRAGSFTFDAKAENRRLANADRTLLRAMDELCVKASGTVEERARQALRRPFRPVDARTSSGPPFVRAIGFEELGANRATLILTGSAANAPAERCEFSGQSDDMRRLVVEMQRLWSLSEPVAASAGTVRTSSVQVAGRTVRVRLQVILLDSGDAGSVLLTVER